MASGSKWAPVEAQAPAQDDGGKVKEDFPALGTEPVKEPGPAKAEGGGGKVGWRQVVLERVRYQESIAAKKEAAAGYPAAPKGGKGKGGSGGRRGGGGGPRSDNWGRKGGGKDGPRGGGGGEYWNRGSEDGLGADDFVGEWLDSLGHTVTVSRGPGGRGPLTSRLVRGNTERILSLRHEPNSGVWACGNAVMDMHASTSTRLIWATYDGRRSVWRRQEVAGRDTMPPPDLLPWLLTEKARSTEQPGGVPAPKAAAAKAAPAAGKGNQERRVRNKARWEAAQSSDEEDEKDAEKKAVEEEKEAPAEEPKKDKEEEPEPGPVTDNVKKEGADAEELAAGTAEEEASAGLSAAAADGARVSAIMDVRQVLGHDRNAQELLSAILMDHDLVRGDDEDAMVPGHDSPLWDRLPEVPRKNALQRLASFHASGCGTGCPPEAKNDQFTEIHVGRHRFSVAYTDVQALLRKWQGPKEDIVARTDSMAHVFSLYHALESPLSAEGERSSMQLSWDPLERKRSGITYELFASPFNTKVEAGRFASRWPHIEAEFGSIGAYPHAIDLIPEDAIVGVNPPFSDGYLEHLMGGTLERIVGKFKRVHLFCPVREASWRPQLQRLKGAGFVRQFWDCSALKERLIGQPVLYWEGDKLGDL